MQVYKGGIVMEIPKCKDCYKQDECDIYQDWLNTRDCCCPFQIEERKEKELLDNIINNMALHKYDKAREYINTLKKLIGG